MSPTNDQAGRRRRSGLRRLAVAAGTALFVLLVLAGGALAVLSRMVDPEAYRAQLTGFVTERSGRTVTLDGPLTLSWLPQPRLRTGPLRLANAPGFDPPMLEAAGAELVLRWWPMVWQRRLEAERIILHAPVLRLQRLPNGRSNWEDLLRPRADGTPPALALAAVAGLGVKGGRVQWDDRRDDRHWRIEDLELSSHVLRPGQPTAVSGQARWRAAPGAPAQPLSWRARVLLEPDAKRILLAPFRARLGGVWGLHLDVPEMEYRLDLDRLDLARLAFRFEGLPAPTSGRLPTVRLDLRRERLTVPRVELDLNGVSVNGSINGTHLFRRPHFYGRIFTRIFDLRALLGAYGVDLAGVEDQSLTRFSLHAVYERGPGLLRLQEIKAIVDDAGLSGRLEADGWGLHTLDGSLVIRDLDLDRYLTPAHLEAAQAAGWSVPGASLLWYPVGWTKGRRLNLQLRLERTVFGGLRTDALQLSLRDTGARAELIVSRGRLYGGRVAGRLSVDYDTPPRRIRAAHRLRGVALGELLADAGFGEWLQGRGDLSVRLEAVGDDGATLLETARGELRLRVGRGRLSGLDPVQLLAEAVRRFEAHQQSMIRLPGAPGEFEFTRLAGTWLFSEGLASNNDLTLVSVPLRGRGRGTATLLPHRLDYTLELAVLPLPKGHPAAAPLAALRGLTLPVRLRGPLDRLVYDVDVNVLLRRAVEEAVRKKPPPPAATPR